MWRLVQAPEVLPGESSSPPSALPRRQGAVWNRLSLRQAFPVAETLFSQGIHHGSTCDHCWWLVFPQNERTDVTAPLGPAVPR